MTGFQLKITLDIWGSHMIKDEYLVNFTFKGSVANLSCDIFEI